jgi:hypothetical protein
MSDHIQRLIEIGSTGLDLSPGDPYAAWAVREINELRARIGELRADGERLDWFSANSRAVKFLAMGRWLAAGKTFANLRSAIDSARGAK